jgi:hypothetical protein
VYAPLAGVARRMAGAEGRDKRAEITETPTRIMTEPNSTKHVGLYVEITVVSVKMKDSNPLREFRDDEITVVSVKMKDSKHLLEL